MSLVENLNHLRELVNAHQVVYEVRRLPTGIDVELYGTHGARIAPSDVRPGCAHCEEVWEHLREIALAALPPDARESRYEIRWFRPGLTYDPKRQPRADVELVLEIRHGMDEKAGTDLSAKRCVEDIVANLRSCGSREGTWARGG